VNPPARSSDQPIRLVLVELVPQVAEIVRELVAVAGTGIQVVFPDLDDRKKLPELLAREHVDVVIVPTERSGFVREYHDLLLTNPDVKVLTIVMTTASAMTPASADLHELCFLGKNIGEQGLVEAIRGVVRRERAPGAGQRGG
jgi:DNA-binding NarL/FixJ family response regulator